MTDAGPLRSIRRLTELHTLGILDTAAEPDYDDLAALAAVVCHSPVAAVNFVDDRRHFTKAIVGMPDARGSSIANDVSFCAATVCTDEGVLVIPDTHTDAAWRDHPLVDGGPEVRSYAGAAIVSRGERVGVVCAFGSEARGFSEREVAALAALARQTAKHLDVRRSNIELRGLALTDHLTGLANRTLLFDRLSLAIADRRRAGHEIGVLFCDVDDFKAVNDRSGHEAGDRLLCDIADHLRRAVRDTDTVARIAGDEFALVCPRIAAEADFAAIAERVASITRGTLATGERAARLSVGWALVVDGDQPADVLRRADAAMYRDKARAEARLAAGSPDRI
jgi:diguanylate cyclase (GGDEF)-like protein